MNQPNAFLIQRKALARFRKNIPFLAFIPGFEEHRAENVRLGSNE